jgi:hypothetical protein
VLAARRAYADAVRWTRQSRRDKISTRVFTRAAFVLSVTVGMLVMSIVGLLSPKTFGSPGSRALAGGWATASMLVYIAVLGAAFVARRRKLAVVVGRVTEAIRGIPDDEGYEGAVGALSSCPAPLRARYALGWVWGPVAAAVLGGLLAMCTAYFIVDATLARFDVGAGQPLYGAAFAVLCLLVWRAAAPRLLSWRVAYAANRDASDR